LVDNRVMRLRFWLGFAVVAAIAIGSVAIALVVHDRERDTFERTQRNEAVRSARQVEALAALSAGQLASAAAFYQAEGSFTSHEFEVMSDSLLSNGALSASAFIRSVPLAARARYERDRGFPIVERSALGNLRRAAKRPQYFPLTFAATKVPLGIQTPLGYDVGSDPIRSGDLLRARDSGEPAATQVVRLPLGGTGINVFRPVYRDGAPTGTVAQRRAALVGFATGAFHVSALTGAATTTLPDDVDAQLREGGQAVSGPRLDRDEAAAAPVKIADRTWLLVVRDPNLPDVSLPILIAVVGISLAALLAALVLVWSRNERMQELRRQASQDPLTGLKNRRRFDEDLQTELARSRRERRVGALLMLDLDNFKRVNDTLGHPAGDRVIGEIASVLRDRMRETDVVARLGGDEFAVVLPHCDIEEARGVATAIATAIREHVPREEGVPSITASIGVAMFGTDPRGSFESVLADADAAMYDAKRGGRDAVRVATSVTVASDPTGPRAHLLGRAGC
jgi:diguanylate cyclase (GGDEF)-like protein